MSLAELRNRALNRTEDAILRESLCLDEQLADQIATLAVRLDQLRERRESVLAEMKDNPGDRRLSSNPVAQVDAEIKACDAELQQVRGNADEETIVVVFRRLVPTRYEEIVQSCLDDNGQIDSKKALPILCTESYLRTTSIDGEDLEFTWTDLVEKVLSHGDRDRLEVAVLNHNRSSVVLPFSPRRSASRGRAKR